MSVVDDFLNTARDFADWVIARASVAAGGGTPEKGIAANVALIFVWSLFAFGTGPTIIGPITALFFILLIHIPLLLYNGLRLLRE